MTTLDLSFLGRKEMAKNPIVVKEPHRIESDARRSKSLWRAALTALARAVRRR